MNNWHTEIIAELHRKDLINDSKQIHVESPAKRPHIHRPSLVARTTFNLANWMISKGKRLRKQNEAHTFSHVH